MKAKVDKDQRDIRLEVGDLVYVKLMPHSMRFLAKLLNEKLALKCWPKWVLYSLQTGITLSFQLSIVAAMKTFGRTDRPLSILNGLIW